jgi:hypothetical protein
MTSLRPLHCSFFTVLCLLTAVSVGAQQIATDEVRRELADLRAEIRQLRAELDELRELRSGQRAAPRLIQAVARTDPAAQSEITQPSLEVLQAQVAELAQVKVESTSRMPVKLFGTIHTSVFANSANPNWLDLPNIVNPVPADGRSGSFSAALRQTRLGFTVDGPTLGTMRTTGAVAMDFFGGIPGFATGQVMGLPRLLVAFARLETERTALEIGQDHMVLAPTDPTSLAAFAFPALFRSGNLYLRTPQVRLERALTSRLRLTGGIVAPIAGDVPGEDYRFVPPALNGERSRRPAVQARIAFATAEADAMRRITLGLSGHYGWELRSGQLDENSATAVDFAVRRDVIGAAGELFFGENIDAFGSGVDAVRTRGGWAEFQLYPSDRLTFAAGAGVDELRGFQRVTVPRRRNRSAYGTAIYSLTPEVQASFEYRWLATLPASGAIERRNHHFDWTLAYKF